MPRTANTIQSESETKSKSENTKQVAPETESESEIDPPLKAFIDVFHDDWQALPLAAKLAKIAGVMGNVPKKGYNQNQHYRFARETDLVAAVRPYLAAAGILLTFSVIDHQILARPDPAAKGMLTMVTVHWTATDGKEVIFGDMPGYGMDSGDKGVYKAVTGAKKYILMTLFLIDTGDDPEDEPKQRQVTVRTRDVLPGRGAPLEPRDPDEDGPEPIVEVLARTDLVRGGHTTEATDTQRSRLIETVRQRGWTARVFLTFIRDTLDASLAQAPEDDATALREYINAVLLSLTPEDMGKLLVAIDRDPDDAHDGGY